MRMDETQRGWLIASAAILAVALAVFVPYAYFSSQGPRGGSAIGLLFGAVGFAFMIFAALLGARKRVPTWRLGRAQAWMRGHLWLGLLSLPILLFHGGFHFGGTLTRVLMWLLIIVVGSGVFGAVLQHYFPGIMTSDGPLETIYDEIAPVREQLLDEADRYVETWCGSLHLQLAGPQGASLHAGGFSAMRPITPIRGPVAAGIAPAAAVVALTEDESAPLRRFYLEEMRPFLDGRERVANGLPTKPGPQAPLRV